MSFTLRKKPTISSLVSLKKPKRKLKKLKRYQRASIKFGISRPAAGFFLAPGLGKTRIAYVIFKILKELNFVDELLVVAKRRIVYNVWRQESKKWRFPFKIRILHGKDKERNLYRPADVRLINYEGLDWLKTQKKWFRRPKRMMLVCDESSKLRHTNTLRFRSLKKILKFFKRRYILTGSPAPNGLMNLFGQVYVLDLGHKLGAYITEYRNNYFHRAGYMGYGWKLNRGADKRIFKRLKPLIIRYGTDELDLPPLTFIDKYVTLPRKARAIYDELEKEYLVQFEEGDIVAANAAVASGKLRQIANGGVWYSKSGEIILEPRKQKEWKLAKGWRTVHDEKCEELVELLEELGGEPALVAFEYQHDKFRLQKYFKTYAKQFKDAPFLHGKTKDAEMERVLKRWDRGELPVVFGHPDTVAHGLNLQGKGGIVIFFAMTWNLENYEQFIQRVWRQGQKRRVLVYRIIARDTVDEDMINALAEKDHNQTTLLEAMERRVKKE